MLPHLHFLIALLAACGPDLDGDGYGAGRDCDPQDHTIFPGANEVCDGKDNDCDGFVDEGVSQVAYWDKDGDGFGDPEMARRVCELPPDGVLQAGDCDDQDAATFPGGTELCDERDNDCDELVDEDVQSTFYLDEDGDGHGVDSQTEQACSPPEGFGHNVLYI